MNFFSSDAFLGPLARVAFSTRKTEVGFFRLGDQSYRMLAVDGVPLASFPFMDFLEPARPALPDDPPVEWLPYAADAKRPAGDYRPALDVQPAPTVELSSFATREQLWKHVHSRNPRLQADDRRVKRKLEEHLGALRFEANDTRPEAFQAALKWKSAQYRATGLLDMFASPVHRALFEAMREEGTLQISTLSAGDVLVAVHLGMRDGKRFCSWIPAYDHSFSRYSPGRQLLHALLDDCYARGDEEFDFLIGEESYKWDYATAVRTVGELGVAPLLIRTQRSLKSGLKATLKATHLWDPVRNLMGR